MAKLTFRQGIVRHQTDTFNSPAFLQLSGGFVDLVVSPDPTIITFIHGVKDYLFTESVSVNNAWGPFVGGTHYWLYWDLNKTTGVRTFGSTTRSPIQSTTAPSSPQTGQMWFNTTKKIWYEWNGAWVEVIRVFAARLKNGATLVSMSANAPLFTGTQVGIATSTRSGALIFDSQGRPLKSIDLKTFFTTEDAFVTGVPTGASLRFSNILMQAEAAQNLAAYTVVAYSDFTKVSPATSTDRENGIILGIIEEDAVIGESVSFITEGLIFNENWDWIVAGAQVNDPVYNDDTGEIVLSPVVVGQVPVGMIIGRQEILFTPSLFPQLDLDVENIDHGNLLGLADDDHTQYHNNTRGDVRYYLKAQVDTLLTSKADVAHQHSIANVTNLQSSLDAKVDVAGDTMTGSLTMTSGTFINLNSAPTTNIHAANKAYVDQVAAGIKSRGQVDVYLEDPLATHTSQTIVYNNGTSGVGATLTNAPTFGALPPIDGVTLSANDIILIANEINGAHNGVYELTQQGSGSTSFVLTRHTQFDELFELPSAYVFVQQGTQFNHTAWVSAVADANTFVVGTDSVLWIQFDAGAVAAFTDLSDVTVVNNPSAPFLKLNAGIWGNHTLVLTDLSDVTATFTEVNYLVGVTSAVQTQLNAKLNLAGGTMTGALLLNADPTLALHAATKQYVDNEIAVISFTDLSDVTVTNNPASPFLKLAAGVWGNHTLVLTDLSDVTATFTEVNRLVGVTSNIQTQLDAKLNLSGGTLTNFLTLHADPSSDLHAATKQYVDDEINNSILPRIETVVTTGTATAYVGSTVGSTFAGQTDFVVAIIPHVNSGAGGVTLNLDGQGADDIQIVQESGAGAQDLPNVYMTAGSLYLLRFATSKWVIVNAVTGVMEPTNSLYLIGRGSRPNTNANTSTTAVGRGITLGTGPNSNTTVVGASSAAGSGGTVIGAGSGDTTTGGTVVGRGLATGGASSNKLYVGSAGNTLLDGRTSATTRNMLRIVGELSFEARATTGTGDDYVFDLGYTSSNDAQQNLPTDYILPIIAHTNNLDDATFQQDTTLSAFDIVDVQGNNIVANMMLQGKLYFLRKNSDNTWALLNPDIIQQSTKLHLIQRATSNGQTVIDFGQAITDDLSGTQGVVKTHLVYRNGILQTNELFDSLISPVTGDYSVTDAGAGEITFAVGLTEDDIIVYMTV